MGELIQIDTKKGPINAIIDHAKVATSILIIAHGAGASMHHDFMKKLAGSFHESGVTTVRFNFPYMDQGKKFPGNPKSNIDAWLQVANWADNHFDLPIFLSGKSYGGRMASHLLEENSMPNVKGVIYLGFPLHAPVKLSTDRSKHLINIQHPQLFLQGTNDALANIQLIRSVISGLSSATLIEFEGADHSFKAPAKKIDETIYDISSTITKWLNTSF